MANSGSWLLVGAALLVLGGALGAWVAHGLARMRFEVRLKRVSDEMQQRHATVADQLRAAQVRAQTELEQSRNSFKRQLLVMSEEPRAALARSEDRLKAAYAELDRLRGARQGVAEAPDHTDGFASTRPMRDGL